MLCSSASGVVTYIINGLNVTGLPPYSFGYVNGAFWCVLVTASVPFARFGVRAAHTIPPEKTRLLFVVLMIGVGLHMIVTGG
jgi:hypothetical protein